MTVSSESLFGTDGFRGPVGIAPISPDWILKFAWALGKVLTEVSPDNSRITVIIGKDTRISGYMFESVLEAGLVAAGVDVLLLGPMSTPGIAYLTRTFKCKAGIVISASHNGHSDNGIKLFMSDGTKFPDSLSIKLKEYMAQPLVTVESSRLGRAMRAKDPQGRYIEFCKSTFPNNLSLDGFKIVVDCANGATYNVAPSVFQELGATVIAIGVSPNGLNINYLCGATSPQALAAKVKETGSELGIALDGDGDRVIFVDHTGEIVDGDELLYIITRWYVHNKIDIGGVAGTLMSNLGLEDALDELKIPFCRTNVGDRHVLEALKQRNWLLGGESSGHILCLDAHSTGDGIISALRVLASIVTFGQTLFEQRQHMQKHPQVLINVPLQGKIDLQHAKIQQAIADAERTLGKHGRVLLRASGTEPLVRVMVEGTDKKLVDKLAQQIANEVMHAVVAVEGDKRAQIFSGR